MDAEALDRVRKGPRRGDLVESSLEYGRRIFDGENWVDEEIDVWVAELELVRLEDEFWLETECGRVSAGMP